VKADMEPTAKKRATPHPDPTDRMAKGIPRMPAPMMLFARLRVQAIREAPPGGTAIGRSPGSSVMATSMSSSSSSKSRSEMRSVMAGGTRAISTPSDCLWASRLLSKKSDSNGKWAYMRRG